MTSKILTPRIVEGVPEITPEELSPVLQKVTVVDVRQPDEFDGELSHIPDAYLMTLGPDLDAFLKTHNKEEEIVFVCRSGARSGRATMQSRQMGFTKTVNLQGGMILWNQKKFPTARG